MLSDRPITRQGFHGLAHILLKSNDSISVAKHLIARRCKTNAVVVAIEKTTAVGLAYIRFAIDKPAFFRAMWREETIYTNDAHYRASADRLSAILKAGFADTLHDTDPLALSTEELLAWSSVHGLANLYVDSPVGYGKTRKEKLQAAAQMIQTLKPVFYTGSNVEDAK